MKNCKPPLILNVTNYVAMNVSANVLLAWGASPIMSFFPDEMEEITGKCDALVINIGCLGKEYVKGAVSAAGTACRKGIPWVLDPVGVGMSRQRNELCVKLVRKFHPAIIRANASEVVALACLLCDNVGYSAETAGIRGVDSTIAVSKAIDAAKQLAAETGAVVSLSGATDYVTDGDRIREITGGSPIMPQITAMGCCASALTSAIAAVTEDKFEAACRAMEIMASAGEYAAGRSTLPGTFQQYFLDGIRYTALRQGTECRSSIRLYLVTDRSLAGGRDIADIVLQAVKGGVTMVQLREKDISTDEFITLGRKLKKVLQRFGVPLIVNDRVDVALACDADGVHIGQSDMPYEQARRLMGPDKIIGLSVENMEQVRSANGLDVDYIGISPVFSTATKTDTATPFGLEGLREASRTSNHPVVAIGGINISNAREVIGCGADGIAVVSAIISSDDPCAAARSLSKTIEQ